MTRELLILRHGKSDWSTGQADFDRPIKNRGKRGAQRIGLWLLQQNLLPDLVLSSPAARAIVTAQKSCKVMGKNAQDIQADPRIYEADSDELIALLQEVPADIRRVMLVGHNPGLEDLLMDLSKDEVPIPEDGKLLATATLARLTVECEWAGVNLGCAQLLSITRGASLPK
jgi:phosphohistidine phosphatase|tara:strand:- start:2154 stop:2666 length:513 start_codon:yes stop_codon:yes gene_type:complete